MKIFIILFLAFFNVTGSPARAPLDLRSAVSYAVSTPLRTLGRAAALVTNSRSFHAGNHIPRNLHNSRVTRALTTLPLALLEFWILQRRAAFFPRSAGEIAQVVRNFVRHIANGRVTRNDARRARLPPRLFRARDVRIM